jgi:hypothetical protein
MTLDYAYGTPAEEVTARAVEEEPVAA